MNTKRRALSPLPPALEVEPSSTDHPAPSRPKRRTSERFHELNDFVDGSARDLSPVASMVWIVLFRDTKTRTGLAKSAQSYIAKRLGVATRTVRRAIQDLERAGLLTVVHRGGSERGLSVYRIHGSPKRGGNRTNLAKPEDTGVLLPRMGTQSGAPSAGAAGGRVEVGKSKIE